MSSPEKPLRRKRRLFPRNVGELVKEVTKPLMQQQGKIYGALLRDWGQIVGAERARISRPQRVQFTTGDGSNATLHLAVRPAMAPELAYATEQMIEQCARYFGYRAITRIVLHASHTDFNTSPQEKSSPATPQPAAAPPVLPPDMPAEMRAAFLRMAQRITSASDKKN